MLPSRLVAIVRNRYGWNEAELRETLACGVLPRISFSTGVYVGTERPDLFTVAPPINLGTIRL